MNINLGWVFWPNSQINKETSCKKQESDSISANKDIIINPSANYSPSSKYSQHSTAHQTAENLSHLLQSGDPSYSFHGRRTHGVIVNATKDVCTKPGS
jgi:hypothetical protein